MVFVFIHATNIKSIPISLFLWYHTEEADIVLVGMIRLIHQRSFLYCGTQRATIVVLSVVNDLSCDYDGVI